MGCNICVKLIFLLAFALLVHIQHELYTLKKNVYHTSYWGQFTMRSVLRETRTRGMNATLERGNSFKFISWECFAYKKCDARTT